MRASVPHTLDVIPDALLSEFGLSRGCYAARESYQCEAHAAIMIPLSQLFVPPALKMDEERLRWVLRGFRDNLRLPAVPVFRDPAASQATVLDGVHRFRASEAVGFRSLPCTLLSRAHAEAGFDYSSH
jgi:hypothetical protein